MDSPPDLATAKAACRDAILAAQQAHRAWRVQPDDLTLLEQLVDARRVEVATATRVVEVASQHHVDAGAVAQFQQLRDRLAQHLKDAVRELAIRG